MTPEESSHLVTAEWLAKQRQERIARLEGQLKRAKRQHAALIDAAWSVIYARDAGADVYEAGPEVKALEAALEPFADTMPERLKALHRGWSFS